MSVLTKICLALIALPIFISSHAQFRIGFKGGLNISSTLNEHGTTNWKPAYHIGVTVEYGMSTKTSIVADLLYSDKGFSRSPNNVHFSYINLPIFFRYNLTSKLAVEGGGAFGYLLGAKSNGENMDYLWGNKADWELCTGVCYAMNEHVSIGIRYEHGLSNVINKTTTIDGLNNQGIEHYDPILSPSPSPTLRDLGFKDFNRNFQLSVSYFFR